MKVFLQSRIVDEKNARVSVLDHGFLYGDGIYETVHAYDGRVFHWPEHFKRLKESARRIQLKCPWSSASLLKGIRSVLRANRIPNASVRITISRGPGPVGLDPRLSLNPTLVMIPLPHRDVAKLWRTGVTIGIPSIRRNHTLCLDPRIKSNNSLNTILAKIEGTRMGVFEMVLLNLDGDLTEGTISNTFFVKKGALYTPSLDCGLLEGVTRGAVMKLARRAGYRVREGKYTLKEFRHADEIFLTSTTLEIVPVIKVQALARSLWTGHPGPVTRHLHQLFRFAIIRG